MDFFPSSFLHKTDQHRVPLLLQVGCALFAHIQIIADQEALITDQPFTNGAVVHMLCRIPDCCAAGISEFLLIQRIVDDLLALCGGWYFGEIPLWSIGFQ